MRKIEYGKSNLLQAFSAIYYFFSYGRFLCYPVALFLHYLQSRHFQLNEGMSYQLIDFKNFFQTDLNQR